jgi:hypothetical protein
VDPNQKRPFAPKPYEDVNPDWIVCFTGGDAKYWWEKIGLTSQTYRHCYILQYQPPVDSWVILDWKTGKLDVMVIDYDELRHIFRHLEYRGGVALLVNAREPERDIEIRFPIVYCVQACLHVLGMATRWTFTPQQLYKRLINQGARIIVDERWRHGVT